MRPSFIFYLLALGNQPLALASDPGVSSPEEVELEIAPSPHLDIDLEILYQEKIYQEMEISFTYAGDSPQNSSEEKSDIRVQLVKKKD